jgi:hypothetical protein
MRTDKEELTHSDIKSLASCADSFGFKLDAFGIGQADEPELCSEGCEEDALTTTETDELHFSLHLVSNPEERLLFSVKDQEMIDFFKELKVAKHCQGTTKKSTRCHNRTRHPSGFCHCHRDQIKQ